MPVTVSETRFGRRVGQPRLATSGTREWLSYNPGINIWRSVIGEAIKVESAERVVVTRVMGGQIFPTLYEGAAIRNLRLQTSPTTSFRDLVLWRRRHYSWQES